MNFGAGTYGIALLAGLLTTLSPCVLPLIPILMGSAVTAHRLGPWALAGGVALSFTVAGVFLASVGASLGLDGETFRLVAALLLIIFGLILLSGRLQALFVRATAGLTGSGNALLSRFTLDGLGGQFALGLLLGIVWSPCVGPTLGAATTLASQGRNLAQISLLMAVFGVGRQHPPAPDRISFPSNIAAVPWLTQQGRSAWEAVTRPRVALARGAYSLP
jgi:cytochrome c-type biogenesis protein